MYSPVRTAELGTRKALRTIEPEIEILNPPRPSFKINNNPDALFGERAF